MLYSALGCIVYGPIAVYLWLAAPKHFGLTAWLLITLSGFVHFGYALVLQRGYQVADLSVVYPAARGSGPLLATVGAVALLGEGVTWESLLGTALIVAGIVTVSGGGEPPHRRGMRKGRLAKGLEYGLATGVCIAAYTLVDASVVRRVAMAPLLMDYMSNAIRTVLLLPAMIHRRKVLREALHSTGWEALGVAVVSPLSYILVLYAMRIAPVTHVAPAREISMLFAVLAGAAFLGEPQGKRRLAGAGVIALGVVFLSMK